MDPIFMYSLDAGWVPLSYLFLGKHGKVGDLVEDRDWLGSRYSQDFDAEARRKINRRCRILPGDIFGGKGFFCRDTGKPLCDPYVVESQVFSSFESGRSHYKSVRCHVRAKHVDRFQAGLAVTGVRVVPQDLVPHDLVPLGN